MEKVYADLIRKGKKTLEEVPERLREKVRALLEAEGGGGGE
ncbi:CD1375 family protein [uncultured Dysosmobacter sp.]|nr:CD1375 family protein [uncultured Dysosmobacter sp.]